VEQTFFSKSDVQYSGDKMKETKDQGEPEEIIERETPEVNGPAKGPSPVIIIIAAVVVLILIIGGIYFIAFSGSDVESLAVGNITRGTDKITFDIMATPSGIGEYSGDVEIEIYFQDQEIGVDEPLYSGNVKINDGWGLEEVSYKDFVWENGEYTVLAKADGQEATNTLIIRNVITSLYVEWQGINSDQQMLTPDYQVEVNVTYMFDESKRPLTDYPQGYDFSGTIDQPSGSPVTFSSEEFSKNLFKLQKRVDHGVAGDYSLTGTMTNSFCKVDSPYRTISVSVNRTYTFDAHPFAIAGDDITTTLVGGEADVNFDGSGSWDDGSIVEYEWEFGDNSTDSGSSPHIQHTYSTAGTYYVTLTVTDNKGQRSTMQSGLISTMSVQVN
jgi:PKD domain-containing protein